MIASYYYIIIAIMDHLRFGKIYFQKEILLGGKIALIGIFFYLEIVKTMTSIFYFFEQN